jgi:hypothetical protein
VIFLARCTLTSGEVSDSNGKYPIENYRSLLYT